MSVPVIQQFRVARYILGKKLRGEKRYPLVLMLEPLFPMQSCLFRVWQN